MVWVINMQVQKEHVRKRILSSAQEEFLSHGYKEVSIRQIAKKANTTAGNIYSYFPSKDELFKQVIYPVLNHLEKLLKLDAGESSDGKPDITYITSEISKMFLSYKKEFMILLTGSAGSAFEGTKIKLTSLAADRFKKEFIPLLDDKNIDDNLSDILAVSFVEGLISLFNIYHNDDKKLDILLKQYIDVFFYSVKNKL